jgi:phosphate transport system substrate-binding protein
VNRIGFGIAALGAWLALTGLMSTLKADTVIRVGGTSMALALSRDLGAAFARETNGAPVEVLPSMGSTGGMQALADRAIDIGLSGRPLKQG